MKADASVVPLLSPQAYLLVVSGNGEMDTFDEELASRQIAFSA